MAEEATSTTPEDGACTPGAGDAPTWLVLLLGTALTITFLVLGYAVFRLWPDCARPSGDGRGPPVAAVAGHDPSTAPTTACCQEQCVEQVRWFGTTTLATHEQRVILLVFALGLLGSVIAASLSFATFVGNRDLRRSWGWWYVLRVPSGGALALIVYVGLRGGLLASTASSGELNLFGIAALAALTGLFSRQAIDKLREVFEVMFRARTNEERKGKTGAIPPKIVRLAPSSVTVGTAANLTITGEGFSERAVVLVGEAVHLPTSATEKIVIVALTVTDTAAAGELRIRVRNPNGDTSAAVDLEVRP